MCRLLAVIADSPVSVENLILKGKRPFIELSHKHNDGWGIGYRDYPFGRNGHLIHLEKSPHPAYMDERFSELARQILSPIIVVHLRDAKYGDVTYQNAHPFYARGWVFAHNGSIEKYAEIEQELTGVKFEGETDSERYFHLILKNIDTTGDVRMGIRSAIQWLEINHLEGARNFVMSDGRRLYAYRHGRDLFYIVKEVPVDSYGHSAMLAGTDPQASSGKTAKMVVVASEPLTDESWHDVDEDHLLVVDEDLRITIESVAGDTVHQIFTPLK